MRFGVQATLQVSIPWSSALYQTGVDHLASRRMTLLSNEGGLHIAWPHWLEALPRFLRSSEGHLGNILSNLSPVFDNRVQLDIVCLRVQGLA